jgi:DNA polymerase III delta subunit
VQNPLARAFELADALGERQMMRLLQTLNRELETLTYDREKSEIGLLYGLISKIRAMIFAKEMMKEGLIGPTKNFNSFKAQLERVPATLFAGDKRNNPLSINPYVLFRAAQQAGNYSTDELVRAMEILLDANLKLVSGAQDKAAVLQQAVIRIAQPPARQTV